MKGSVPYTAATSRGKGDTFDIPDDDLTEVNAYRRSSPVKSRSASGAAYEQGDEDEDFDDDLDDAAAYAAFLRGQAEMRARFNFKAKTRKTLGDKFIDALRRKRRILGRNENLRFRELYKPPEPIAVLLMVMMVTVVTLILTKSWPFY